MHNYIKIESGDQKDTIKIIDLLKELSLPYTDIDGIISDFLIARSEGEIIGCIGLEIYKSKALLRSFGVKKQYQGIGIGNMLYNQVIEQAGRLNVSEVYLLTETAERFFAKREFQRIDRNKVPLVISKTSEFKSLCPETAICMKLSI